MCWNVEMICMDKSMCSGHFMTGYKNKLGNRALYRNKLFAINVSFHYVINSIVYLIAAFGEQIFKRISAFFFHNQYCKILAYLQKILPLNNKLFHVIMRIC